MRWCRLVMVVCAILSSGMLYGCSEVPSELTTNVAASGVSGVQGAVVVQFTTDEAEGEIPNTAHETAHTEGEGEAPVSGIDAPQSHTYLVRYRMPTGETGSEETSGVVGHGTHPCEKYLAAKGFQRDTTWKSDGGWCKLLKK